MVRYFWVGALEGARPVVERIFTGGRDIYRFIDVTVTSKR
jgi:hypothetical protein